jgi:hypothetical protein
MLFEIDKTDISHCKFELSQELIQHGCHHIKKLWYQKNKIDQVFRTLISGTELSDFKVISFHYF